MVGKFEFIKSTFPQSRILKKSNFTALYVEPMLQQPYDVLENQHILVSRIRLAMSSLLSCHQDNSSFLQCTGCTLHMPTNAC